MLLTFSAALTFIADYTACFVLLDRSLPMLFWLELQALERGWMPCHRYGYLPATLPTTARTAVLPGELRGATPLLCRIPRLNCHC